MRSCVYSIILSRLTLRCTLSMNTSHSSMAAKGLSDSSFMERVKQSVVNDRSPPDSCLVSLTALAAAAPPLESCTTSSRVPWA